ncbi:MAG: cytochrome c family protein [Candidatus Thiodiazotropha sp. (ex Ctena orbiculata)]|uniref:Cytochrome c family protein n=1 Tax=Candidatus Thiodiazotropha taylori TaxID=2792791 RepID=A0A944MBH9_9GAMM|nr:cytochrome c family protein [Candidatus Thiodiazotropha taylori]PUB81560.1 MAG: cytochrome c family protein [gamma proteobacterium symbiont of Ctena orbiculata]MBT2990595.1 cytochrome c family protein [Candidatus Thiodiazotropha taylori]MBT2998110.1 cytochrome c family protein [Candidatus Thiodiazotropha taylori]MBT3002409.1 cytochrome c family protein [Candidatus Thiodiazotropha taylori]
MEAVSASRIFHVLSLLFTSLILFVQPATTLAATDEPLHQVSSEVCKNCHKEIYKQWKGSMHAQSTALKDPIHATFYKKVVGSPVEEGVKHKASGKYPICLQCHAPNAAVDKTTKLDAKPAYTEGVNCVACHTLAKFKGTTGKDGKLLLGLKAYERKNELQGPQGFNQGLTKLTASDDLFGGAGADDDSKPNPHTDGEVELDGKKIQALPMAGNPGLMKTNAACMGCHDKRNNPHGVPLCQTGNEYAGSNVNCQSCHMPVAGGMVDHGMGGGHNRAMLKRSVVFTLDAVKNGENLNATVKLKNMQPHSLPTGAPFRNIYLKLAAYDASGNVVWQNAEGHPANSDSKAYFAYLLADDKGDPAMPPKATQLGVDSRLKPYEERILSYTIPAKGAVLVRGELFYNLLWPVLVEKFKHLPEDLVAPESIAIAEVSL